MTSTSHSDCSHDATKTARAKCRKDRAAIDIEARDLLHFLRSDTHSDPDYWVHFAARHFAQVTEGTATEKSRAILDYFAPSGDDRKDARRRANGYTITTSHSQIRSIILRVAS